MAAINRPLPGMRRPVPLPRIATGINWWVLGAVAIAAMSAMVPVLQNSTTTSRGYQVQQLQAEQATLRGQIGLLESDVARLTSLTRIQRRAAEIGLAPSTPPIFVSVSEPGPVPAKIPAEYLPPLTQEQPATDTWWHSLLTWLPLPE
ncbi:hypothetical protein AYO38_01635 [bacterium SCGC AG-212-C10]|nr:hypothetical protein AYO38_01635 [bacterium SCGC AG-212-C10]